MRPSSRPVMKVLCFLLFQAALGCCQDENRYSDKLYVHGSPQDDGFGPSASPASPPPRLQDLYLDKYLETQDPKFFDPSRYPAPSRDPFFPQGGRDGTPDQVRTDYIPQGRITFLLEQANEELSQFCTNDVSSHWEFETDINEATQIRAVS